MKILWLNWKDLKHPLAGGAEVLTEELCKRLVKDGHEVILLTSNFEGGLSEERINGYKVIRVGGRYSVYWKAYRYYKDYLQGWADLVVDEVNTMPFFTKLYAKERNIVFFNQFCREIWFYQFPWFIGWIGYIAEFIYMRILMDRQIITISESSKEDLIKAGFNEADISIITMGVDIEPANLVNVEKYSEPTILSLGNVRAMKRTLHQVKAFEVAREQIGNLKMIIAGDYSGSYGDKVLRYIENSKYKSDISVLGKVSNEKKRELMQKSHLILVTSVKEGWGLIVTEANSQGTPAVVYNVDGLRDSVKNDVTGKVTNTNTEDLGKEIVNVLKDKATYSNLQKNAYELSLTQTYDNTYIDFVKHLKL